MISIEEAFQLIDEAVQSLPHETVTIDNAVGRTLAQPVVSDVDSPPHDKSVMDGFAVQAADVGNGPPLTVIETIVAGSVPKKELAAGQAARIMTGAPLPNGADAVVMIEKTDFDESRPESVTIELESLTAGQHVMRRATTVKKGDTVFAAGHQIRATDIGLLAECGAANLEVVCMPSVALVPTGDELVDCHVVPGPGQIRNSNGPMLVAMAQGTGLQVNHLGIGRDDQDALRKKIELGLESDLLILSGGVSAGTLDLVPGILKDAGVEQVFHKVKVKPGKPIWFGVLRRPSGPTTYVFGLPGNPVSSMVGFQVFVKAAIRKMTGLPMKVHPEFAILEQSHQTRGDRPTYWPGQMVASEETHRIVKPLVWHGSSDLRSLGQADTLIYFPADRHDHPAGQKVAIYHL